MKEYYLTLSWDIPELVRGEAITRFNVRKYTISSQFPSSSTYNINDLEALSDFVLNVEDTITMSSLNGSPINYIKCKVQQHERFLFFVQAVSEFNVPGEWSFGKRVKVGEVIESLEVLETTAVEIK